MAGALTLGTETGRVRARRHASPLHGVRAAPLPAAPLPLAPMTARQREALHDLIHAPASTRKSRWEERGRASDLAWVGVLALLLAACIAAPLEDLGYLDGAAFTEAVAQPHVDARVARA